MVNIHIEAWISEKGALYFRVLEPVEYANLHPLDCNEFYSFDFKPQGVRVKVYVFGTAFPLGNADAGLCALGAVYHNGEDFSVSLD